MCVRERAETVMMCTASPRPLVLVPGDETSIPCYQAQEGNQIVAAGTICYQTKEAHCLH